MSNFGFNTSTDSEFFTRAAFDFFQQVVILDKILSKAKPAIAPGIDLELRVDNVLILCHQRAFHDRNFFTKTKWNDRASAGVIEIGRGIKAQRAAIRHQLDDKPPKETGIENAVTPPAFIPLRWNGSHPPRRIGRTA